MAQHPVLPFDTHAAVVSLVDSGMPERQAETVVRLQVRLIEQHFATRADVGKVNSTVESFRQEVNGKIESFRQEVDGKIESLREEVNGKIESLRQEFKADLASLKSDLIKWMIGTNLAFATLLIAAIKIF